MKKYAQSTVDLGKLALLFSRVDRATLHEDGITNESDSDHTVMLALIACAFAERFYKDTLDLGKVAQFAIVHDLVEVYAGDTDSLGISQESKKEKDDREQKSLDRIKEEFDTTFPWISATVEEYESHISPEARFIKILDKVMPKITGVLNNGARFKRDNKTKEEITRFHDEQHIAFLKEYSEDFPEVINIMKILMDEIMEKTYA